MGVGSSCCSLDFFRDLLLKYGEMFIRLIITEKMRIFLEQKFQEIMAIIKQNLDEFVKKVNEIVDEKIKQFQETFQEIKKSVEQMFPGKISEIESKQGTGIGEFTGFSGFLLKIDEIRDNALLKLEQIYKQITGQLSEKKTQIHKQIQEERPNIPLYDSLSQKNKNRVFKKAEEQFGEKIEEASKSMETKCSSKFDGDVTKMSGAFDSVNPEGFLEQFVVKCAKQMLGKLGGETIAGCLKCF